MSRVVEIAPERWDDWVTGFAANQVDSLAPQRISATERFDHDPVAVLLVRRGGYAVAVAGAGALVRHKVGTRRVQSRTAAGGWSQQRFARRRGNQADELVRAVADHFVRVLAEAGDGIRAQGLVTGGDRTLVGEVLTDPRLRELTTLPRRDLYDLPDPNRTVLDRAVARARTVRVTIED